MCDTLFRRDPAGSVLMLGPDVVLFGRFSHVHQPHVLYSCQQSWQHVPGPKGSSFLCPQLSQVRTLPMKSGSDRYRIWCWVGFWHGWQKAGRSRVCMILGRSCRSTNVGEGGKSSQKLLLYRLLSRTALPLLPCQWKFEVAGCDASPLDHRN